MGAEDEAKYRNLVAGVGMDMERRRIRSAQRAALRELRKFAYGCNCYEAEDEDHHQLCCFHTVKAAIAALDRATRAPRKANLPRPNGTDDASAVGLLGRTRQPGASARVRQSAADSAAGGQSASPANVGAAERWPCRFMSRIRCAHKQCEPRAPRTRRGK